MQAGSHAVTRRRLWYIPPAFAFLMAPWTSSAAAAMLRKFSPRTDNKNAVQIVEQHSARGSAIEPCSLSDAFAAVLLDDALSRSSTGMATEQDAAPPPAAEARAAQETKPRSASHGRRCNAASEALKAAESGLLSPRELRLQRTAAREATLIAVAEASAVAADGVPDRSAQSPEI